MSSWVKVLLMLSVVSLSFKVPPVVLEPMVKVRLAAPCSESVASRCELVIVAVALLFIVIPVLVLMLGAVLMMMLKAPLVLPCWPS